MQVAARYRVSRTYPVDWNSSESKKSITPHIAICHEYSDSQIVTCLEKLELQVDIMVPIHYDIHFPIVSPNQLTAFSCLFVRASAWLFMNGVASSAYCFCCSSEAL